MKEFNLSEKIFKIIKMDVEVDGVVAECKAETYFKVIKEDKVKEFIKLLKEKIGGLIGVNEEINKLAGEDLI